ncbi:MULTISPECIES: hypothetical protein [unclassified Streptomyces]|uniref:hypothetical protein n=1 Tax=unclassified Streptomyces TaxID=2593676 RepID=UPI0033A5EC03
MLTDQQEQVVSAVPADYGRIETRRTSLPPVTEGEPLVRSRPPRALRPDQRSGWGLTV